MSNTVLAIKKPEIYQGNVISNFLNVSSNEMPKLKITLEGECGQSLTGGLQWRKAILETEVVFWAVIAVDSVDNSRLNAQPGLHVEFERHT